MWARFGSPAKVSVGVDTLIHMFEPSRGPVDDPNGRVGAGRVERPATVPSTTSASLSDVPVGPSLATALAQIDRGALTASGRVEVLVARSRLISHLQAALLADLVAVADAPTSGHPVPEASEDFDADEISMALCWTRRAAVVQLDLARDLTCRLPDVHAALAAGVIDLPRARVFSTVLEPVADADIARRIASRVLPVAAKLTTSQIRDRLHRRVLAADPDAARRRYERSTADRDVRLWPNPDGTATLIGMLLPPARAAAAYERVDAIARGIKVGGDGRTLAQLRADTLLDLLDGTVPSGSATDRPGVIELSVPWETVANAGNEPGDLGGFGPVLADIARQAAAANHAARWRYTIRHPDTGELLHHGTTRVRPMPAPDPSAKAASTPTACPPVNDPDARYPSPALRRWINVCATRPADSRPARRRRAPATSTTQSTTRTADPPNTTTSPSSAGITTGSNTKAAGDSSRRPTAPSPGPHQVDAPL
jgi:hypothetical protein